MVKRGVLESDGEEWDDIAQEAKDFIGQMITKPERRISAEQALQNAWLQSFTQVNSPLVRETISRLNINNMKQFYKSDKIKKVALMAIAAQSDPNDMRELKQIFQALDRAGNGHISLEELQRGLGDRENADEII